MRRAPWVLCYGITLALCLVGIAGAQTPDAQTPAEEEACDKYKDEGARYGLCVAYCEAQDCESRQARNGTELRPPPRAFY